MRALKPHLLMSLPFFASFQACATISSGLYMAMYFFTIGFSSDATARSKNSVFVQNGHTAITCTPCFFSSRLSARL